MVIINAYYKDSTGLLRNGWFTGIELDIDDGFDDTYYNPVTDKYVWVKAYNECPYAASTLTNSVLLEKRVCKCQAVFLPLCEQQKYMFDNKVNRVDDRIVSISQPYIRPIVRGKAKSPTEFGAK